MCTSVHAYMRMSVCVYLCMRMYVCVHVCMCVHLCMRMSEFDRNVRFLHICRMHLFIRICG